MSADLPYEPGHDTARAGMEFGAADAAVNEDIVVRPTVMLRVDSMRPNTWNPNEQTDEEFALLVEAIRQEGFSDPVNVCPLSPPEGQVAYEIIGGEHRWGAARVLGMFEIPSIVYEDYDQDRRKMLTIKLNALHGKVNATKFTKLYNEMLRKYRDPAILQKMMGFATEAEFKKLYRDVKQALPLEFQKKLSETKNEIQTVDDLSLALNRLFSEHGSTLAQNFMIFSYGGREHLMLRCSARTWALVTSLAERAAAEKTDANVIFADVILRGSSAIAQNESDSQMVGSSDGRGGEREIAQHVPAPAESAPVQLAV